MGKTEIKIEVTSRDVVHAPRPPEIVVKVPTIYMDGGLIQGVEGFPAGFRFDVVDYDAQEYGSDDAGVCHCKAGEGQHYHSERKTDKAGRE